MPQTTPPLRHVARLALRRGVAGRCPQCGVGPLFCGWNALAPHCTTCGLDYEPHAGNSWWFMYYTTAFLTGLVIIVMLLLHPTSVWVGRLGLGGGAIGLIIATLPLRKGIAVALDYLTELRGNDRPDLCLRDDETGPS